MYIYIYIYREREREWERCKCTLFLYRDIGLVRKGGMTRGWAKFICHGATARAGLIWWDLTRYRFGEILFWRVSNFTNIFWRVSFPTRIFWRVKCSTRTISSKWFRELDENILPSEDYWRECFRQNGLFPLSGVAFSSKSWSANACNDLLLCLSRRRPTSTWWTYFVNFAPPFRNLPFLSTRNLRFYMLSYRPFYVSIIFIFGGGWW